MIDGLILLLTKTTIQFFINKPDGCLSSRITELAHLITILVELPLGLTLR